MPDTKFKYGQRVRVDGKVFEVRAAFFDILSGVNVFLLINPTALTDSIFAAAMFGAAPTQFFAFEGDMEEIK